MRVFPLILALGMAVPSKVRARTRSGGFPIPPRHPQPTKEPRRRMDRLAVPQFPPLRSPCGRHVVEVEGGAVFLDGERVYPTTGSVQLLAAPIWRPDGEAVAWLERGGGETRLVVLPDVEEGGAPLAWSVPATLGRDRVHWAEHNRVVIGPEPLQPRAIASWSE